MKVSTFNPKDYGIPVDKFRYVAKMIQDGGVTVSVEQVGSNPVVNLTDAQQVEDLWVKGMNARLGKKVIPRRMTMNMFKHVALTLSSHSNVRSVVRSLQLMVYNKNGDLIPNPQTDKNDKIDKDSMGTYLVCVHLYYIMKFWEHFVADDIYMWAEKHGCANLLQDDNSYLYTAFDHQKDTVQLFVDIFGYDVMERAVEFLSVCDSCGESNDKS